MKRLGPQTYLFDLEKDIREEHNIAEQHPDIVKDILQTAMEIKRKSPPVANYFKVYPYHDKTIVPGDCSSTDRSSDLCRFIHPWLADDIDPSTVPVVPAERGALFRFIRLILFLISPFVAIAIIIWYICCSRRSMNRKLEEKGSKEKKLNPFENKYSEDMKWKR